MSSKLERRAAVEMVAENHEGRLAEIVQRVGDGVDRFRGGELAAFEVDLVISQYSGAAKELWKFCLSDAAFSVDMIRDGAAVDWWEPGAPRHR